MKNKFNKEDFQNKLINIVTEYIFEEINEEYSEEINLETKLFGGDGPIDSMGLVALIVRIEEYIEEFYDFSITLASEKAMSRRTSPFSRVKYLLDYIEEVILENE